MANLLTEYRKRHGASFIVPMDEGLCFFNGPDGQPAVVAVTSSPSRSMGSCRMCVTQKTPMIVEVLRSDPNSLTFLSDPIHQHILPDADLVRVVHGLNLPGGPFTPVTFRGDREVEGWLWRLFSKSVRGMAKRRDDPFEDMVAVGLRNPPILDTFFKYVFQPILLNRRYLLISR